ncbi:hypothetical protein QIA25_00520 (plasmid) [Borreliella spielmanii]|uniref:Bbs27 protein n=1 Tax=Borreliella spielmanii A14S TaxID=498742 RepID=C0RC60_9SPIR|nr:hypothetical protein [Borreliella spielmanii]ACN53332.1 conserved hypothetical protein [Borreliella spielmanii A14S]WKC83090.1 hypothetical protein QIA25_00520 [Borreliella spielmanii]
MREVFLIFILFFCLAFNLHSYTIGNDGIVKVKIFNFKLNQQRSFEELERDLRLFIQKVGSKNVLNINHKILFTGVEVVVMVIYKLNS